MIKEFQFYIDTCLVKEASPDIGEAESLFNKAEGRLEFSIKKQKIDENTAPYIFEDVYDCMREAAQSLMSLKVYKPYSHEAITSFLKEFFNLPEFYIYSFDRYRILRNKAVYRGEKISADICKQALNFLLEFLPKLKIEFNKLIDKNKL